MKFLLYTHYVYYTIKDNTEIDKKYHGILNVKTNKIMFNTDEKINTFIPYSNYSMLVITDESAYELCIIQDDNGKCLEQCSSENLLLSVDGNICSSGSSCGEGKYMLKPEGVCISECNTSIYIKIGTECGLCRDIGSGQYKILDRMEYKYHKKLMNYSDDLDVAIKNGLDDLINRYKDNSKIFSAEENYKYCKKYEEIKKYNETHDF